MSINVVVQSTAAGVSVSGGTAVSIEVQGGVGPAGFITAPGTATSSFGVFQLAAGSGITITTTGGSFLIASYTTTEAASFAPVQSVAGRTGSIALQAADVTSGTFVHARIPTISYTALSNVPATFAPSAHTHDASDVTAGTLSVARLPFHTHSTSEVASFTGAAAAAAPVQRVQGRTGEVVLGPADITAAASAHTHSTSDIVSFTASAAAAAPVQSVAGRTGAVSLAAVDVSGLAAVAASGSYTSLTEIPSRYSVVNPVLVQGAGMTFTRNTASGEITIAFSGGTSGVAVSGATPQPLGAAAAGSSSDASRADHVHAMPSAADVGAVPSVNGISSAITIAAGDNVTVSTASSTITIAAGGGGGGIAMSYLFS